MKNLTKEVLQIGQITKDIDSDMFDLLNRYAELFDIEYEDFEWEVDLTYKPGKILLYVHYELYRCGDDWGTNVWIDPGYLNEEGIEKLKELDDERKHQERIEKRERLKREEEQRRLAQEEYDRKEYERLKKKFEKNQK